MRLRNVLPALMVCAVLLAGCGEAEAGFEGAVMGDAAAAATDDPSEDTSEDPTEDPSADDPGAQEGLELPDEPAATGARLRRKGFSFAMVRGWSLESGSTKDSFDVGPKDYTGESLHVFMIPDAPYTSAQEMAPTPGENDRTTDHGFVEFAGQEWSFTSSVVDEATGRRVFYLQTPHRRTAYFLSFWGDPDQPESALENIAAVMQTWRFR